MRNTSSLIVSTDIHFYVSIKIASDADTCWVLIVEPEKHMNGVEETITVYQETTQDD